MSRTSALFAELGKRPREHYNFNVGTWLWKDDLTKLDRDESAWKRYDKAQSDKIERMYARGAKSCKIGNDRDARISFRDNLIYRKSEPFKLRPVRRIVELTTVPFTEHGNRTVAPPRVEVREGPSSWSTASRAVCAPEALDNFFRELGNSQRDISKRLQAQQA
jgi:hypothetical protein